MAGLVDDVRGAYGVGRKPFVKDGDDEFRRPTEADWALQGEIDSSRVRRLDKYERPSGVTPEMAEAAMRLGKEHGWQGGYLWSKGGTYKGREVHALTPAGDSRVAGMIPTLWDGKTLEPLSMDELWDAMASGAYQEAGASSGKKKRRR